MKNYLACKVGEKYAVQTAEKSIETHSEMIKVIELIYNIKTVTLNTLHILKKLKKHMA